MRPNIRASVFTLALAVSTAPLAAQGWIIPRPCGVVLPRPVDDRPVVRDCRSSLVRTRSDVRVELVDRVLRYEVEERFVNRGGTVGEADYLFPLPKNAAFQDLKLSINGELVAGETMAADTARRIYENIVRAQRDPALVEWMGHGLLRARIFPINPGEEKKIVVRFQSVAPREGDALRIDYFRGATRGASTVQDGGTSSFALSYREAPELGTPYSPTHALDFANRDGRRVATVRGDARDVTLLVPMRRSASASISMLPYSPGNEEGFSLITITPPLTTRGETTPRDITLVLDVSGSMQGRKIEQARAAGRQLLRTLRPDDRFRLIDFASDVRTFRDEFVAATPENLRAATRYLDALEATGSTNIEGALREAVRVPTTAGRLPLVLFMTDGEATVGERRAERLATIGSDAAGRAGAQRRIFTFGLGADVNVSLLEQLALEGRGSAEFVRPDESVERMVGVVANRLVDPVLTDVRVFVEGDVRLSKMLPAQPSDMFADRDLVILARYTGHGSARVVVEGVRRNTPVRWTTTVDFPDRERQNPFVARLWAAQRVGFLSADKRRNGGSVELDDEIRMLGERYGIPTEFTSYLVVEPQMVRRMGASGAGVRGVAASAPPAAELRDRKFEAAKAASAQRAANSIAALDQISVESGKEKDASTQRVESRTFALEDGVWTDARYRSGMATTKIKPFSRVYFDLMKELPDLRAVFALGDRVIVVGRAGAIQLAEDGVESMTGHTFSALTKSW
jgi:Ca-activated chloride channel family protein